jgi:hypothetical protein
VSGAVVAIARVIQWLIAFAALWLAWATLTAAEAIGPGCRERAWRCSTSAGGALKSPGACCRRGDERRCARLRPGFLPPVNLYGARSWHARRKNVPQLGPPRCRDGGACRRHHEAIRTSLTVGRSEKTGSTHATRSQVGEVTQDAKAAAVLARNQRMTAPVPIAGQDEGMMREDAPKSKKFKSILPRWFLFASVGLTALAGCASPSTILVNGYPSGYPCERHRPARRVGCCCGVRQK